ncbi:uncharacterized protein [Coffea arabica]|uniref:Transposase Tnp1/En/Spm-like domain-containing protein n=1 Tax=Coffea arabica TaxID=13443 RepID=A0ABM4VM43_COFAR
MARTRRRKSYRGSRSFQLRDEDPENLENEEGTAGGSDDDQEPKKTRGPTYMRHIWGRHGTDKRIKEKFDLSVGMEERVKQSVGKKWRSWKHALKKTYFNPNESIESQVLKRPKRILPQQWRNILAKWLSEESKRISATNKKHREKKKMNHSTRKKPFAQVRVEKEKEVGHSLSRADMFTICYTNSNGVPSSYEVGEKMEEIESLKNQLPEGEEDSVGRNDVYAKVMDEERSGRVRTYGLGVTQSDLWGDIPSRLTCFRLVGDKVTIRSMVDSSKICAVGVVRNLDPTVEVGDIPLGSHWCEVHVNVLVENDEELMRPYHNFLKIGVAIAWPINLVIFEEN